MSAGRRYAMVGALRRTPALRHIHGRRVSQIWHVHRFQWLESLPPSLSESLQRKSAVRVYQKGEMVFAPAPEPRFVCALVEGLVRLFRSAPSGDELTVGYVRPGEVFGELAALEDKPREQYAEAKHRSKVLRIPKEEFLKAVTSNRAALFEVTKQVGGRLRRIESRLEDLVFRNIHSRLARLLLQLAEDFGEKGEEWTAIELPLTQQEIANLLGATRQTINSTLGDLSEQGLIEREGRRILLLQPQRLRELSAAT